MEATPALMAVDDFVYTIGHTMLGTQFEQRGHNSGMHLRVDVATYAALVAR